MGDKIDPKVIKRTQDTLGKIIKKPPLTEKLLSKPPFRFLHDICTSVIKNTGLMKGLFTDSEMQSENVKDKESKVAFLQKAIDLVSLIIGKPLAAKPSKIVAGHEPEKTNEFLQGIAEAVNKKVDNDEYVKKVLTGDKGGSSDKTAEKKSKEREKSADGHRKPSSKTRKDSTKRRDKDERSKDESRERSKDRDRDREKDRDKRRSDRKDREEKDRSRDKERSKDKDEERRERPKDREERHKEREGRHRDKDDRKDKEDRHRDKEDRHKEDRGRDRDRDKEREERHKDRERRKRHDDEDKENQQENNTQVNGEGDGEPDVPPRLPRPTSAKGSRRRQVHGRRRPEQTDANDEEETQNSSSQVNGHVGEDDLPPQVQASRRMARPSSARPAPPRVKKNEAPLEEPVIVGSGNVPNIITDKGEESDDDDIFVAKDEEEPQPEPEVLITRAKDSDSEEEEGGDHGGLVKKMMEAKAQLEHGSQSKEGQKKTEIERSSQVNDVQRRKERELVKRDIEKLRGSIQTLTRSVNPLGKILDFVQEDMDSMQKELDMWKKENRDNQVALQREQSITDSSVEPLRAHLGELDNAIKDQLDLIAAVKANVLKNDDKITKMLGSITKS